MSQGHKTFLVWVLLIIAFLAVYLWFSRESKATQVPFSTFTHQLEKAPGEIATDSLRIRLSDGNYAEFRWKVGKSEVENATQGFLGEQTIEKLNSAKVRFEVTRVSGGFWQQLLVTWLPMMVLVVLFLVFMRNLQVGGSNAKHFGKSKAKLLSETQRKVEFKDIGLVDEAKDKIKQIVAFLKDPKKFTRLGAHIPKGALLVGPPGTGKTLLARAMAGEAGVPFFSISGSDFVEMFVGVGASRVRDLFDQAKRNAPCILFIDEIDAVGRHRGAGIGGGHDEREQTLNQLLVELDGFESNDGVIVLAATNRADILDPALVRPGRFDRRIEVPLPDTKRRHEILKIHTRMTPLEGGVDLEELARTTEGMTGADLENLVNETALVAANRDADRLAAQDFKVASSSICPPIPGRGELDSVRPELDKVHGQVDAKDMLVNVARAHYGLSLQSRGSEPGTMALLIGASGTGKTELVRTLASHLRVPCAVFDAAATFESRGADGLAELMLRRLLKAANGKVPRAEYGIICLQNLHQVTGNGGAAALLFQTLRRLVEGERIEVRLSENLISSSAISVQTRGILFILEGSFGRLQAKAFQRQARAFEEKARARRVVTPAELVELGTPSALADQLVARSALFDDLPPDILGKIAENHWDRVRGHYWRSGSGPEIKLLKPGLHALSAVALDRRTGGHAVRALLHELFQFIARTDGDARRVLVDKAYVEDAISHARRSAATNGDSQKVANEQQVLENLGKRAAGKTVDEPSRVAATAKDTWATTVAPEA